MPELQTWRQSDQRITLESYRTGNGGIFRSQEWCSSESGFQWILQSVNWHHGLDKFSSFQMAHFRQLISDWKQEFPVLFTSCRYGKTTKMNYSSCLLFMSGKILWKHHNAHYLKRGVWWTGDGWDRIAKSRRLDKTSLAVLIWHSSTEWKSDALKPKVWNNESYLYVIGKSESNIILLLLFGILLAS